MVVSTEKAESNSQSIRVDSKHITVESLTERGFTDTQAQAIIDYAILLTGSARKVDDKFRQLVREKREVVDKLGLDVRQETVEFGKDRVPLRTIYTADWERPDSSCTPWPERS